MRGLRAFFAVATVLASLPALAQAPAPGPDTDPVAEAAAAVRLAKAAFEYRDFQKVVDTLDPWLHPPRIVDDALEVRARELLGVSLHVLGKPDAAADEFALLLKLDPDHELDPFVVPPRVMQTFEEVRAKMKPALDARRRAPPPDGSGGPPPERVVVQVEQPPSLALAIAPLGVPQFAADEPAWGVFWIGVQLLGVALNVVGFAQAERSPGDSGRLTAWTAMQFTGLAIAGGGWAGGSIQGYGQLQRKAEAIRAARDAGPPTAAISAPGLGWSWHF